MKTLKTALAHTFTGVATERELLYSFLVLAIPVGTILAIFFKHVTI